VIVRFRYGSGCVVSFLLAQERSRCVVVVSRDQGGFSWTVWRLCHEWRDRTIGPTDFPRPTQSPLPFFSEILPPKAEIHFPGFRAASVRNFFFSSSASSRWQPAFSPFGPFHRASSTRRRGLVTEFYPLCGLFLFSPAGAAGGSSRTSTFWVGGFSFSMSKALSPPLSFAGGRWPTT